VSRPIIVDPIRAGDTAIVGYHAEGASNPDKDTISFVLLKEIGSGKTDGAPVVCGLISRPRMAVNDSASLGNKARFRAVLERPGIPPTPRNGWRGKQSGANRSPLSIPC
jgi:hypothetical protein